MNVSEVVAVLKRHNPTAKEQTIRLYAQCFVEYSAAVENIEKNGTICAHPRTAQPIENPYLPVKAKALAALDKLGKGLETDQLWAAKELEGAEEL